MMPHNGFDMRFRTKRGLFSRFNLTPHKARKTLKKATKGSDLWNRMISFLKGA